MLQDEYFVKSPPKTTGRELFHAAWATNWRTKYEAKNGSISDFDWIATLTELTAASIAESYKRFGLLCPI